MHLAHLVGLGAASGLLLFAADFPIHAWPLAAVALIPVLFALGRREVGTLRAALAGLVLGVGYTVPLSVALQFPLVMSLGLGAYVALSWAIWGMAVERALRWPAPWGALAAGAAAVVVEWAQMMLVPVWGTAQSSVKMWSAAPGLVQFVAVTGMLGLVFALVAGQALVVALIQARGRRAAVGAALIALVAFCAAAGALAARGRETGRALRVAALGWTQGDLERRGAGDPDRLFEDVYRPLFDEAVRGGAQLVVSPEAAFILDEDEVAPMLARFSALAKGKRVALAVGYFHVDAEDNRIAHFDESGLLGPEYRKTHLIPLMETYHAGDGSLVRLEVGGARVGGMICQDDNFTDLARGYGRSETGLVVVPTNDWRQVKEHHFENGLFRTIENHYAVVRAASNGISAVVAPGGRVLASADHYETGPRVVSAEVAIGSGGTFYSRAGDWFPIACALGLAFGVAFSLYRRRTAVARAV